MAESETRLETLEDEVKVLKGEVKRTLVDLRALLMREDSPLGDGALTRRAAMSDQITDDEMPRNGMNGVAAQPVPDVNIARGNGVADSGNIAAPLQAELAETGPGLPSDDLPGGPPQGGPGPAPVPGVIPGAAAGSPADRLTAAQPGQTPLESPGGEAPLHNANHQAEYQTESSTPREETEPAPQSHGQNGQRRLDRRIGEKEAEDPGRAGKASSVYDEYRELLEETRQTHTIEDSPVGPPLDINLLSNLVYWTALAKQRVGEEQLKEILQLYIQSGHSRPELQDLMLQISSMVDADPVLGSENPRDWVELMFHLHGILTGGFPVIKLPNIRLSARAESEGDRR